MNLVAAGGRELDAAAAAALLASRRRTRAWRRTPSCPTTRACGPRCSRRAAAPGAGCVYDVDRIVEVIAAGVAALDKGGRKE